jgi:ankyrin repeat protein
MQATNRNQYFNYVDISGNTELILAAQNGHKEIVSELLDRGADVNASNNYGITALIYAAQNGHKEIVNELLDRGADVNASNNYGITALIYAARNGHTEIVNELLDNRGANVNAVNQQGDTSLICAARNGHTEIVEALLDEGADVYLYIALICAVEKGHTDTVNAMLVKEKYYNYYGISALILAAKRGHTEIVKAMLDRGANVNVNAGEAYTVLMLAAQNGHAETISALLERDANVNAASDDGNTALMLAAKRGHAEIVTKLLKHGGKIVTAERLWRSTLALTLKSTLGCLILLLMFLMLPMCLLVLQAGVFSVYAVNFIFYFVISIAIIFGVINLLITGGRVCDTVCCRYLIGRMNDGEPVTSNEEPLKVGQIEPVANTTGNNAAAAGSRKGSVNSDGAAGESKESSDQSNHKPGHTPTK